MLGSHSKAQTKDVRQPSPSVPSSPPVHLLLSARKSEAFILTEENRCRGALLSRGGRTQPCVGSWRQQGEEVWRERWVSGGCSAQGRSKATVTQQCPGTGLAFSFVTCHCQPR